MRSVKDGASDQESVAIKVPLKFAHYTGSEALVPTFVGILGNYSSSHVDRKVGQKIYEHQSPNVLINMDFATHLGLTVHLYIPLYVAV